MRMLRICGNGEILTPITTMAAGQHLADELRHPAWVRSNNCTQPFRVVPGIVNPATARAFDERTNKNVLFPSIMHVGSLSS